MKIWSRKQKLLEFGHGDLQKPLKFGHGDLTDCVFLSQKKMVTETFKNHQFLVTATKFGHGDLQNSLKFGHGDLKFFVIEVVFFGHGIWS